MRIAYLIPEFPGQTHTFIWRERLALSRIGVTTYIISTRRPRIDAPHPWANEAKAETVYLSDGPSSVLHALVQFARLGPAAWLRGIEAIWGAPSQLLRSLTLLLFAARLVHFMRANNLTHVHSHSCADSALIAMFANRLGHISYSLTLHGNLTDYGQQQKQKWQYACFGITITRRLREQVFALLGPHAPRHIGLAPMGVDPDLFKRNDIYQPWDRQRPLRLFSCARLNVVKGHQEVIRAVSILRTAGMDVELAIAGEDEIGGLGFHRHLDSLIDSLSLRSAINLLGPLAENEVIDRLRTSHIFVLASHSEPLGVAIMEALSCEIPVIATNLGGVPELIDDGLDGCLIAPKDPKALADAIENLAHNPALARRFSSAGRLKIVEKFNSNLSALELKRMLDCNG